MRWPCFEFEAERHASERRKTASGRCSNKRAFEAPKTSIFCDTVCTSGRTEASCEQTSGTRARSDSVAASNC